MARLFPQDKLGASTAQARIASLAVHLAGDSHGAAASLFRSLRTRIAVTDSGVPAL